MIKNKKYSSLKSDKNAQDEINDMEIQEISNNATLPNNYNQNIITNNSVTVIDQYLGLMENAYNIVANKSLDDNPFRGQDPGAAK